MVELHRLVFKLKRISQQIKITLHSSDTLHKRDLQVEGHTSITAALDEHRQHQCFILASSAKPSQQPSWRSVAGSKHRKWGQIKLQVGIGQ